MLRILVALEGAGGQLQEPLVHGDPEVADHHDSIAVEQGHDEHGPRMADHLPPHRSSLRIGPREHLNVEEVPVVCCLNVNPLVHR